MKENALFSVFILTNFIYNHNTFVPDNVQLVRARLPYNQANLFSKN